MADETALAPSPTFAEFVAHMPNGIVTIVKKPCGEHAGLSLHLLVSPYGEEELRVITATAEPLTGGDPFAVDVILRAQLAEISAALDPPTEAGT